MHIPLDAGQVFVRTGRKQLLLAVGHIGLLVEEVVIAHRSTERWQQVVGHTDGEQAGDVAGGIDAVVVGGETSRIDACVILHIQIGIELIFHTDIQFVPVEIEADDGRQSPAFLITIQFLILSSFCQHTQQNFLLPVRQLCRHGLESSRCRYHCLRTRHINLDITQVARIIIVYVVHATTNESRKMFVDLIGDAQLKPVEELAALHVAVHVVAVDAHALSENRQHGDDGLEGGQALVERSLTTTTCHGKTAREYPVAVLVGRLEAGNDGSRSLALEELGGIAPVLHAIGKGSEGGSYLTRLIGTLNVQRQMQAITALDEGQTGRIGVNSIDTGRSITRQHAQE